MGLKDIKVCKIVKKKNYIKSGIPSPAPDNSSSSSNVLFGNTVKGSVKSTISSPTESSNTCGSTPVAVDDATPATNATIDASV